MELDAQEFRRWLEKGGPPCAWKMQPAQGILRFAQSQVWEGKVQQQLLGEPPRKNLFSQFSGRLKEINSDYSSSVLLTFGAGKFFVVRVCLVPCRMLSSNPGLSPLDARRNPPAQFSQPKMSPGFSDSVWGVKSHTAQLRTIIIAQNEGEELEGNSR